MTWVQAEVVHTADRSCAICDTSLRYYYSQFKDMKIEGKWRYLRLQK